MMQRRDGEYAPQISKAFRVYNIIKLYFHFHFFFIHFITVAWLLWNRKSFRSLIYPSVVSLNELDIAESIILTLGRQLNFAVVELDFVSISTLVFVRIWIVIILKRAELVTTVKKPTRAATD